jgi:hypothetical protein
MDGRRARRILWDVLLTGGVKSVSYYIYLSALLARECNRLL